MNSNTTSQPAERYLTEPDAAATLGLTVQTLRLWRKTRGIPFIKLSHKCVRYRQSDIDAWMAAKRVASIQ